MLKTILGIDVSKKTLDVVLMIGDHILAKKVANTVKGFKVLQAWLVSLHIEQVHACLESTGVYGEAVAEFLHEQGHRVSMVNPMRISGFAKSDLKRNKTDSADALTIARFCRTMGPKEWHPQPVEFRQLRALTRRLETLERMLGLETNRLESAPASVRPSIRRMIRSLKKEIDRARHLIKDHVDNHPDLKRQSDLLLSIPGIGKKTACLLLGEIEFNQFSTARAVAAYAGLTPRRSQSGTSVNRTRLSKLGSGRIRKALYFPAITAVKYNQVVIQLAQRLEKNGKPPMQILCASMRKLLHIAFGVIKNDCPFNPNSPSYI